MAECSLAATGTALTKVPFVDALVELAIPLGDAAVELQADDERIGLAVAGSVELADSYELPIAGIPLTLPAHGNASAAMRFGMVSTPTGWMVDPTSFIEVEGNAGIGLGSFGRATGLDLHDIAGAHVSARIDRHGARVQGTANLSIHPAISTGAGAAFDLLVSADDFSKSRLDFDADVTVGGSRLATADVSLSSRGLHVAGGLRVGGAAVDLNGQITPTGADIAGSTSVVFPLDAIADLSDGVRSDIGRARQNLRNYDTAIANRRIVVRDERTARDRGLAHAITAVSNAERSIQQINNTIAHNKNLINQRRSWINSEIRWFNTLPWWRKPVEAPGHAARLTAWNAQIASWDAANAAQRVARDTATAGLRTARQVMSQIKAALAAANVDDDLEIRRLKSTKQVELDLLNTLEATLRQVRPGAAVRGDIAFRLGTSGLSGSLSARYCDAAGCTTLAGGRVRIGNPTEACVDVLALGEACARL